MRAYGADMARLADDVLGRFGDGERRVLHKDLQEVTLSVILRCVFGITESQRMHELGKLIVEYLDGVLTPWFYAATLLLSGTRVRDFLRARGRRMRTPGRTPSRWPVQSVADRIGAIDAILFDEIARCRQLSDDERRARHDILSLLVAARYDDGSGMSDEALRDHLMTLLIGGHETTATSLCWALYCALSHPGTIEKMRAEVRSVMGDGFDAAQVKQLAFVGAVVNESMRLYPIAWGVPRQLKQEMRVAGRILPAGQLISASIFHTQRDPRVWEAPAEFRPERFIAAKASVYTFFPFGAGVWRCLGAQFAEYEMRVVLARIVQTLDLELASDAPIRPLMRGFTIAPSEGLPVRVHRRRSAEAAA
jgi:cytochrome P450